MDSLPATNPEIRGSVDEFGLEEVKYNLSLSKRTWRRARGCRQSIKRTVKSFCPAASKVTCLPPHSRPLPRPRWSLRCLRIFFLLR